ncbi:MAG: serine/threonine-protein kinase, partial [Candidatus Nanopelagicales bacterium]
MAAEPPVGSPLSLHDPRSVGPWQVHSRLGSGGMGVVYYATAHGSQAALKVIRPGLLDSPATRERFSREVAILRAVRDVHISQFIDADLDTEPAWLAIEYLSGPVLRDEVAENGPLAEDDWWSLARGLAQALAVLDVHRITHRDLKPGNVILHERGPVLIDFGIAVPEDATSLTATGLVTGSPAWLSPEQANLEHTGPASDIFALGSLLAFAATGRPPFGEGMSVAVLMSIASREPDLAGVDPARGVLLRRMLAKDPAARPTAREVLSIARLGPQSLAGLAGLVGPEEAFGEADEPSDATRVSPREAATGAYEVPAHDTLPGLLGGGEPAAAPPAAGSVGG